jgi:hypothetical protein
MLPPRSASTTSLLLVLVLGAMLQDPRKLDVIEKAVLDRRLPEHLVHILIGEPIAHRRQQLSQPVLRYKPGILLVKTPERVLYHILRVRALQSFTKQRQEHGEVDRAGRLVHHALQVVLGRVLAQRRQHVVQVLLLDEAVAVLVDHVEGLLELGDLGLVEHGEHVGGGALGAFLGRASASCCLARCHL